MQVRTAAVTQQKLQNWCIVRSTYETNNVPNYNWFVNKFFVHFKNPYLLQKGVEGNNNCFQCHLDEIVLSNRGGF